MVKHIIIGRCGKTNTQIDVQRDDGRWTHNIALSDKLLRFLRGYLAGQGREEGWRYLYTSLGATFLSVGFVKIERTEG